MCVLEAVLELRERAEQLLVLFARLQHVLRHQLHLQLLLLMRLRERTQRTAPHYVIRVAD